MNRPELSLPWRTAQNPLRDTHVGEIVLSLLVLVVTTIGILRGQLELAAGIQIDLVTAVLVVCVAMIKQHFTKVARTLLDTDQVLRHVGLQIMDALAGLDGEPLLHARLALKHAGDQIEKISRGIVPLDPREYYRTLRKTLESCRKGSHVYAVSSIDALRWKVDRNQLRWLETNVAAVHRGVKIDRVFVLRRNQMASSHGDTTRRLIEEQRQCGIGVHAVWLEDVLHEDTRLRDDFVLFPEAERAFTDHHDPEEPTRVASAEMIMPPSTLLAEYRVAFEKKLRDYWLDPSELLSTASQ
ncbi:MAG: hypothetical protein ABSF98_26275 [Bryobacteraceae bacterium]